ncbi:MAG TPA: 3'-5' exonuclease, partial [Burkholderiales bacterium]|nr:3'-5' exonuclease [Burkholderiales bacterium]
MIPVLVFDIETIPDCDGLRTLYDLPADLPDHDVAEIAFQKRRAKAGNDFLPTHLQRVAVISCLLRSDEGVRVFSIGEPDTDERATIQRFFEGIDKYVPQLVSWNGRGFDLPVLAARGLVKGVTAGCFWDQGADNKDFKWSNYINRFHDRHLDLMDALSMYGGGRGSPLDELARLAGFPGKLGMDGSEVWESYRNGAVA